MVVDFAGREFGVSFRLLSLGVQSLGAEGLGL